MNKETHFNPHINSFETNVMAVPSFNNQNSSLVSDGLSEMDQKRKRSKSTAHSKFTITNVKVPQSNSNRKLSIEVSISSSSPKLINSNLSPDNYSSQNSNNNNNNNNNNNFNQNGIHNNHIIENPISLTQTSLKQNSSSSRFKISFQPNNHKRSFSNTTVINISPDNFNSSFLSQNPQQPQMQAPPATSNVLTNLKDKDSDSDLLIFSAENSSTETPRDESSDDLLRI